MLKNFTLSNGANLSGRLPRSKGRLKRQWGKKGLGTVRLEVHCSCPNVISWNSWNWRVAAGLAEGSELRKSKGRVQTVKDGPKVAGRMGIWKCRTHLATLSPQELQTCSNPPLALLSIIAPYKASGIPSGIPSTGDIWAPATHKNRGVKMWHGSSHNYIHPDLLSTGWPAPAQRMPVPSQCQGCRGPRWEFWLLHWLPTTLDQRLNAFGSQFPHL